MVSASRPEGLTAPVSTSAIAPPAACPPSHASTSARGVRDDVAQDDRRAVDQHDDDVRVDRRDRLQGGQLVGGQVHVGAVEALRLVGSGQPDHHDDGVGRRAATCSASASSAASSAVSPMP